VADDGTSVIRRWGSTAVVAGLAIDAVVGEPPDRWHPVVWFGRGSTWLERHSYRRSVVAGAVHWSVAVTAAGAAGVVLHRLIGRRAATALAGSVSIAGRMLTAESLAVAERLEADDLAGARDRVARIVGRDVSRLTRRDVARAAVETVAENSVDAVVASLWWGWVAGAPGIAVHRAVNTLDAMIGHRNDRYSKFGRVAARADDVANWIPARLTVAAIVAVRPRATRSIVATVRRDAHRHPSPNGGVVEAAVAGALGVQLGGVNRYGDRREDRGMLGDGAAPDHRDIRRATRLARDAAGAMAAVMVVSELVWSRLATGTASSTTTFSWLPPRSSPS
jgi:adenosylcobinamide-phosphate synthase